MGLGEKKVASGDFFTPLNFHSHSGVHTTWQSSQIHNEKIGVWGALSAPQTPILV